MSSIARFSCFDVDCLKWYSSLDGIYRHHCYWYKRSTNLINAFEANRLCAEDGHGLAPYIDIEQYNFMEELRPSDATKSTQVWLGTHSITGSPSNWNNDPSFVTSLLQSSYSEKCVVINSNLIQSWIPCKTNSSALTGAVCFKHESCGLAGDIPLMSPEHTTSEPEKSNVNMNPTTVETNVNMNPTTFEKNVNMNPTTFEKM
ncbi:unnamed protein product [Mytilus edulis]|uniref:C-type lectin domain-containing protein n=1 Tax=Mytilus edulis TaxID=6550 RepID=A0A8S3SLA6_MYTED|nr:unnamed protein product [Mytilus edulis]